MNTQTIEAIIGAIVLSIAIAFGFLGYQHSHWAKTQGYPLYASFNRVDGLSVGSEVRMSGVKIGAVTHMDIDPQTYLAKLCFTVSDQYQFPTDTVAEISSDGLMGGKYVALVPGGNDDMLKPGQIIKYTQSSVSLEALIGKVMFSKDDKKEDKHDKNASSKENNISPSAAL